MQRVQTTTASLNDHVCPGPEEAARATKLPTKEGSMTRLAQVDIEMVIHHDPVADPRDYLFQDPIYRQEDQARLDAWLNDEWHFVGIRAKGRISIPYGTNTKSWILSEIHSPGLWGIESDSGDPYFQQVFEEEREILIDMLEGLKTYQINQQPQKEIQL
jgi:hypothetical protein